MYIKHTSTDTPVSDEYEIEKVIWKKKEKKKKKCERIGSTD